MTFDKKNLKKIFSFVKKIKDVKNEKMLLSMLDTVFYEVKDDDYLTSKNIDFTKLMHNAKALSYFKIKLENPKDALAVFISVNEFDNGIALALETFFQGEPDEFYLFDTSPFTQTN